MENSYGLWSLVIINSLVFIIFAFSFTKPKTSRDWRLFGGFSAFIVALFTEMYGFPLTIYFFSGWLSTKFPGVDLFAHNSGHLFEDFFGWGGDPHFGPFHIASYILIIHGFTLLSRAWKVLYKAQSEHTLGYHWSLRSNSPPSICWFCDHYVRFFLAMAHDSNTCHVSDSCVDVYTTS